jgi:hypothetical protein
VLNLFCVLLSEFAAPRAARFVLTVRDIIEPLSWVGRVCVD